MHTDANRQELAVSRKWRQSSLDMEILVVNSQKQINTDFRIESVDVLSTASFIRREMKSAWRRLWRISFSNCCTFWNGFGEEAYWGIMKLRRRTAFSLTRVDLCNRLVLIWFNIPRRHSLSTYCILFSHMVEKRLNNYMLRWIVLELLLLLT